MKKVLLSFAAIAVSSQVMLAQTKTVTGKVVDSKGEPAIGASVMTSDEKVFTTTDGEGNFIIELPAGVSNTLIIDNQGVKQNVNASALTDLGTITIEESSSQQLTGVVVTGFRTIAKEKYQGAADRIDAKRIEKFPVSDVTKAIEGSAPGVMIAGGGGEPGTGASVRIRGVGSIGASSAPLIVVDNTPYAGDITSINPLDIENVTILKDAVATSQYGARGSNGVIVITTKRGRNINDKPVLTVDLKTGIQMRGIENYNVMKDAKEYYEKAFEAYVNNLMISEGLSREDARLVASGQVSFGDYKSIPEMLGGYNSYDVPNDQLIDPATGKVNSSARLKYQDDWDKEISRLGTRNEANIALQGNTDGGSNYYMSLGYLKENGFIKRTDYERFSSRINLNSKVNNWLNVGLNLGGTYSISNYLGETSANSGNPMFISRDWAPVYPFYYYDSAGNRQKDPFTGEDKWDWGAASSVNPNMAGSSIGDRYQVGGTHVYGSMFLDKNEYKMLNLILTPNVTINLTKDLTFHTLFNYNIYNSNYIGTTNKIYGGGTTVDGRASRNATTANTYTFRQQLNYKKTFKDVHNLDVLALHENYSYNYSGLSASRSGLPYIGSSNLAGAAVAVSSTSLDHVHRTEGYMISAMYDYNNMFGLEGSFRRDASSRFSPKSRWGNFWALGASWNVKSMDFLQNVDLINAMRFKVSYGTQGNEAFGSYYAWQTLYDVDNPNGSSIGLAPVRLGNEDLTWEKQGQFNVGLEFAMLDRRLNGEINFFNRNTTDMLFNLPIPSSTGFTSIPINALDMYNRGVEVTLGGDIVRKDNFTWTSTFNFSSIKNKITKMHPQQDSIKGGSTGLGLFTKGSSAYDFWLVESAGIYSYDDLPSDATAVDSAQLGLEQYYAIDSVSGQPYATTDYNYAFSNGRKVVGSALPTLFGSWNNQFQIGRSFDISFLMTYGLGGLYYDGTYASLMRAGQWGSNWHRDINNSWSPENPNTDVPRVQMSEEVNIARTSSRFLIDASYLNIRNINMGYTFPASLTDKIKVNNLRLYLAADNIYLLTKRKGMNPQATFDGVSNYSYVPARTIMLGLRFNLQ